MLTFNGKWEPFRRQGKLSQTDQGQSPVKCNYSNYSLYGNLWVSKSAGFKVIALGDLNLE